MFKAFFSLLVVLGFAWGYPPTRVRIMRAIQPAVEALGPAGDLASLPMERYNARTEVKFLLDQIRMHKNEGRELPDERTFQTWIGKRVRTKNKGRDPWGQPYFLLKVDTKWTVGSVGEDGKRGTDDDIKEVYEF